MDFFDVLDRLPDVIGIWALLAVVVVTMYGYYHLFRRQVFSIFDPLGMVLLFSSFGTAFLIVISLAGFVQGWALVFTAATLGLFYGPLLVVGQRHRAACPERGWSITVPTTGSLLVLLVIQLLLQGATYAVVGIPILQESRLTLFAGGGGIGFLGRLKDGLELASVLLPFVALRLRRGRAVSWLLISAVAVGALLSGSKGGILVLPFGWYLAGVYVTGSWRVPFNLTRGRLVLLVALVLVPISVNLWTSGSDPSDVLQAVRAFAVRLVAEGDGYAYFFGDNRIDDIARRDLLALVRPITAALRITDQSAGVTPGFEIVRDLFGVDDSTWGPNTRLPIFILYFYGAAGMMLAPLLGACLVFARNATLRASRTSPARFAIVCSVYAALARTEVDPQIMVNGVFNVLVGSPLLIGAMKAFEYRRRRRHGIEPDRTLPRFAR